VGTPGLHDNLLLGTLSAPVHMRLNPQLVPVTLAAGQELCHPGAALEAVYFPTSAVLAVQTGVAPAGIASICIGREGLVGLPLVWGVTTSVQQVSVLLPGTALRFKAAPFLAVLRREPILRTLLARYAQARMAQLELAAVCNALHPIPARCARWLLQLADHCDQHTLPLTHDGLAALLGVRRSSISVAAEALQRTGLIGSHRGRISIRDRGGLEAAACACYAQMRQAFGVILAEPFLEAEPRGVGAFQAGGVHFAATAAELNERLEQVRGATLSAVRRSAELRDALAEQRVASAQERAARQFTRAATPRPRTP
jgi:CRP-like cAMP-binding protein